jgi:hypothetical protein
MSGTHNPGRVAGLWYLLLVVIGPLRLIYIPSMLFVHENAAATVNNIVAHEGLFRFGMAADVVGALTLVFLVVAFYRLFEGEDRYAAMLVVILGGIMPALLYFVNVASDAGVLMVAKGAGFLSVFDKHQQDALVMLFVRPHDYQNTAAEALWGAWLFPLAFLVYKSRFLPRFIGIWLAINGFAYVILSMTGLLAPEYQGRLFIFFQPALFGEMALMLWLVIKGARPSSSSAPILSSVAS